jgi:hypothetical protein
MELDGTRVSGVFDPLIERQATIPRTVRRTYTTVLDWQEQVHVRIFQGEELLCEDNEAVGEFLHDITPAPAGSPVEVQMSYNLDGLIEVVARDPKSGRESKLRIEGDARRFSDEQKSESKRRIDRRWSRESTAGGATPPLVTGSTQAVHPTESRVEGGSAGSQQDWREHPLYAPMAALVTHAERRLPVLADEDCGRVRDLLRALREAVLKNNVKEAESLERRLTDLLFDLE